MEKIYKGLSHGTIEAILRDYSQGVSLSDMASKYKLGFQKIQKVAEKFGVERPFKDGDVRVEYNPIDKLSPAAFREFEKACGAKSKRIEELNATRAIDFAIANHKAAIKEKPTMTHAEMHRARREAFDVPHSASLPKIRDYHA